MSDAVTLFKGDCLDVMRGLPTDHYDAVITDPPYHLASIVRRFGAGDAAPATHGTDGLFARASKGFMGKEWDGGDIAFRRETWAEVLRVLKPGGHLLAFNHSRTFHHMAVAIEAAGFEARDAVLDLYDTGDAWATFLDALAPDQVGALRRALAGADSPLLSWIYGTGFPKSHDVAKGIDKMLGVESRVIAERPAYGLGDGRAMGGHAPGATAKITEAQAPEAQAPEAQAWVGWGTALKPAFEPIFLARKPLAEASIARQHLATGTGGLNIDAARIPSGPDKATKSGARAAGNGWGAAPGRDLSADRWPANVVHDGSREVLDRFPLDAEGSVARFFYSAKAGADDRDGSEHPTVKPQALMRWLVRMATRRGGLILDPFGGSGSTGWAAAREGRLCHLIEREPEYQAHIAAKISRLADPAGGIAPADPAGGAQISLF